MSEVRIARFVDIEACKSIFSDYSTFVLRSSWHYRRRYETDRGDESELQVRLKDGGLAVTSGFLLSCWTMLKGDEPTRDEWNIFPKSVVAIVSMPSRLSTLLEREFEIGAGQMQDRRRYPFMFVEHKPVQYADEVKQEITPHNITDITVFTKRLRFAKQKEYRFALAYSEVQHWIDTYIFAVKPDDYMEKCFANPEMSKQDKRTLLGILGDAMCGYGPFGFRNKFEIVTNINVLYSVFDEQPTEDKNSVVQKE